MISQNKNAEWIDIKSKSVPDYPVEVRQENGNINYGCYYKTKNTAGIIKLTVNDKSGDVIWDGKTYLIKVSHWRKIYMNYGRKENRR